MSLAEQWAKLAAFTMENRPPQCPELPPEQIDALRHVFYAGSIAMFNLVHEALAIEELNASAEAMNAIGREVAEFHAGSVAARAVRKAAEATALG